MFVSVKATGWKSGSIDASLGMVNALVGPNGSGKSSVMEALRLAAFGEVPGLGKANQSLMRASSDTEVTSTVQTNGGSVSVALTKSGSKVSKSVSGDQQTPEVPLSVKELQTMSAAELRKLMSVGGDTITRMQFNQDVIDTAGKICRKAMLLVSDKGEGTLDDVDQWIGEIATIAKTQASNLRETEAALTNTRNLIKASEPVPAMVISGWRNSVRELEGQLKEAETKLASLHHLIDNARRDKEDAQAAADVAMSAGSKASHLSAVLKECRKLQKEIELINYDKLLEIEERLQALTGSKEQTVESLARRANFASLLETAATQVEKALAKQQLPEAKHKRVEQAIENLRYVSSCIPNEESSDAKAQEDIDFQVRSQVALRESLLKPKADLEALLWKSGFTSVDRLEEAAVAASEAKSTAIQNASLLQAKLAESQSQVDGGEDEMREQLQAKINEIKVELHETKRKINQAESVESLKQCESDLVVQYENFAEESASSAAAHKAAIQVQAEYLDGPIQKIQPFLDQFCDEVGIGRISCQFIKQGRSVTLEVSTNRGKNKIPLDTLSGGENLLVGCAFLYGLNMLHKPGCPLIMVEAAELDEENLGRLIRGLLLAGESGIQSMVTSFKVPVEENLNLICLGSEALIA